MNQILVALALLAAPAQKEAAAPGWLAGTWVSQKGGRWTEERWSPPRGGVMMGTALTGRGDKASGFEYMRIAPDGEGRLAFWGSPDGKPPVPFHLVASGEREAVFENLKHDFPTRIVYRRHGNRLTATISGPSGAGAKSWTFSRRER